MTVESILRTCSHPSPLDASIPAFTDNMADGVQDEAEINEENLDEGAAEEAEGEDGDIYEVEKIVGICTTKVS